jgi:thioredoxin reductase (NADPH)
VDVSTKKNLAHKYYIVKVPSVVLLDKGLEIKRLDCSVDKEKLKSQL